MGIMAFQYLIVAIQKKVANVYFEKHLVPPFPHLPPWPTRTRSKVLDGKHRVEYHWLLISESGNPHGQR